MLVSAEGHLASDMPMMMSNEATPWFGTKAVNVLMSGATQCGAEHNTDSPKTSATRSTDALRTKPQTSLYESDL